MLDILDRLRLKIQRIPAGSYHTCGQSCTDTDCILVTSRQEIEALRAERDSWKREAELNQQAADESAMYAERLATTLDLLRKHGIHVEYKWCWCEPRIESHREGGE